MSLLPLVRPCRCVRWLVCVVLLGCAAAVHADPKPLTKEEQAKVDKAIERGVRFLKRVQRPSGAFPREATGISSTHFPFIVGQTALPALALLECGVAPDDPAIQKAASLLRKHAKKLDATYELPLVLMFLDRLGERQDEEIIRSLALRLVAGQTYTGGWYYRCPHLTAQQEVDLLKALRALQESLAAGKRAAPKGALEVPASLAKLAAFQKPENLIAREELVTRGGQRPFLLAGPTDNSNTQFAMLGLWAARRHDLPLLPTFCLVVRRFECSQSDNGTWSYNYRFAGRIRQVLPANNTGAGLLGLAIGCAEVPTEKKEQERREKQIVRGLAVLSGVIGDPTKRLAVREYDEPNYYLLWTIERVAALYNLQSIGEQDWYRWGASILLANQNIGGEWPLVRMDVDVVHAGNFSNSLNTAFALLFLKRSNLVRDLTAKLPLKPEELNKGIMVLGSAPSPPKDISSPSSSGTKQRSTVPP